MRQLTSVDAQFLALESARQTGHVAGVAILDPSTTPRGELDCVVEGACLVCGRPARRRVAFARAY